MSPRHRRDTDLSGQIGTASPLIEEFARALALCADPQALQQLIPVRMRELAGCESVTFCALNAADDVYRPVPPSATTATAGVPVDVPARGALAKWLRVNEVPLVVADQPGVVGYLPESERALLAALGVGVCVPMVSAHRLLAILFFASPGGRWHPAADVVQTLGACGRVSALACESVAIHHAERERIQSASRAQQLAVAGQLAAAVAHEVRNPLTTIRSSVQYVMESPAEWSDKTDLLREVIGEVDRINRTVSGVLGLSRPQDLAFTDVDLLALVAQSLTLVQPYLVHHRLTLEQRLGPEPLTVQADAAQLRQVILNVLLNACQATPEGGQLSVTAGVCHQSGADDVSSTLQAQIVIADTGPGMPAETLARVFDPFFTTKTTGTGLGLSICVDIMKRHHGAIRLESEVGRGTTAVLTLPVRPTVER